MRRVGLTILLLSGLMAVCGAHVAPLADGEALLRQARESLTGEHKNTDKARALLLEIVQSGTAQAGPETLVWAEIYLGYIEDRAQNRQAAVEWYEKALSVEGASRAALELARIALQRPLLWIRHLDAPETEPRARGPAPLRGEATNVAPKEPPRRAYLTKQPPEGLVLASSLSDRQRRESFEALWSIIDANYGHFKLKSIDWTAIGRGYQARLSKLTSDDDFYRMMFELVNELKDTHSWLANYSAPILGLAEGPELPIDMFRGKPFVVAGAKAGWEVLSVDGMTPAERIEWLRPYLHACSSERAFQRKAGRSLLAGKAGDPVTVTLRSPEGRTETLSLARGGRGHRPPATAPAIVLTEQRVVQFGRYPSGIGYIRIESFNGRKEIEEEFDRALEALRDTVGLILDIRDNEGGYGHEPIVARFLRKRTLIGIGYDKRGPRHDDLERRKFYLEPGGKWQYTRPVALLVNDLTGSASDLLTAELRSAPNVITVGTTTHGNVAPAIFGVLPCGLVVRVSNGYVADAKDRPIEVNGNVPDITVDTDIRDYLSGRDPVVERATEAILAKISEPRR